MASGEYNHANLPDDQLYDRVNHLWEHQKRPHAIERRRQLEHEFRAAVFETLTRWADMQRMNEFESEFELEATQPLWINPDDAA